MAKKKPRTPPPPRRVQPKGPVQAPRQRAQATPRAPSDAGRRRLKLIGLVAAVVAVALAAGLGIALGGGDSTPSGLTAGGCTVQNLEELDRRHATELPKGYVYNSFPPTSGTHHPRPAIWNMYDEPVPQLLLVHNLEHGGIAVQYGDQVPEEEVERLRAWYSADPVGKVVAPLPVPTNENAESRGRVYATAWTHLLVCPGVNEQALDAFTEAYRYEGPERFSEEAMQPGT